MRIDPIESSHFFHRETFSSLNNFDGGIFDGGIVRSFDDNLFSLVSSFNIFDKRWLNKSIPTLFFYERTFWEHHIKVYLIEFYSYICTWRLNYFELLALLDNLGLELLCFFGLAWVFKLFILGFKNFSYLIEQFWPWLYWIVFVFGDYLPSLWEIMGVEGHIQEASHIVYLNLMFFSIFDQKLFYYFFSFS